MFTYRSLNPATEELIQTYPEIGWEEAVQRAQEARKTFASWRETPFSWRRELFLKLASLLREEKPRLSSVMTEEMGKPITQAEAEVEKCALGCTYYAENAEAFLKEEVIATDAARSYVRYDPLGVVLAIMPWNFPLWQVLRCSVPAIMAGNTVLLKPAPNVPGCATAISGLFHRAGFPPNLLQPLFCSNDVTARLIDGPTVQGVTLTGSDRAGSQVGMIAGRSLKKMVMELGGSDPLIILDDANLSQCIPVALRSRMLNTGQSCIASKRFVLMKGIAKEFEKKFVDAVERQKMGDPMDRSVDLGPLAREDLVENLIRQVEESVKKGAKCLTGGERPKRKGYFYLPTVLKEVENGMAVFDEETFGPVAALTIVKDEEEAVAIANRTPYGLGASLWTRDVRKAELLARKIDAGSVFINGMTRSDPRLPFGGIKRSGFGRELSWAGLREFTNFKTVWIA